MDKISIEKIKTYLDTKYVAKEIFYFEQVDSTNDYAKENSKVLKNGSLIIAETQTNGRGRLGNIWESEYGSGIWMSVVLKPKLETKDIIKMTSIVGLAVKKGIQSIIGNQVFIKWPNDIILNKKKVCGVLVESIVCGSGIDALIIGIGINVEQNKEYFKDLQHATSLKLEISKNITREDIIISVLNNLELEYEKFLIDKTIDIDELKSSSILFGKKVKILCDNKEKIGIVDGFTENGAIIIKDENENEIIYNSANISIRGLNAYID